MIARLSREHGEDWENVDVSERTAEVERIIQPRQELGRN
jgi:hypothetical protein